MKKFIGVLFSVAVVFALFGGCSDSAREDSLVVGAAASLTDVMEELAGAFSTAHPDVTLEFTFASSGALQTQIEQGAPIDVFMSAAPGQMNNLVEQGLIYGGSRNVVRNSIVLIVPADSAADITGFAEVLSDEIGLIAIGDPDSVPGGAFAREIFTALGIFDEVLERATLGTDIRQVLTWVEMGEADAGVVFGTDAGTSDAVRVVEIADGTLHSPSVNPVGIVADSNAKEAAQSFIDFLFSTEAMAIFESHGFSPYG